MEMTEQSGGHISDLASSLPHASLGDSVVCDLCWVLPLCAVGSAGTHLHPLLAGAPAHILSGVGAVLLDIKLVINKKRLLFLHRKGKGVFLRCDKKMNAE